MKDFTNINEEELRILAKEKKVIVYKDYYGNKKEYKRPTKAAVEAQKELQRRLHGDDDYNYICNRGETRKGRNKWFLSDQ